jgi:BirA family transcriptional regulator, biotin operon repressor / biotin---[acetyl-CoA-carboxylase] ligase
LPSPVDVTGFFSRLERFDRVGSTNDIVRAWLDAGTPEVCLAVTNEQTAGRGRAGRSWQAPPGAGLLLSLGFRPVWLPADRVWRVMATASLAMAAAAEEVAGLSDGAIRLKWPNDLVIESDSVGPRKLAGVLGETEGLGTDDPRLVVGIGVNADWRAADFPVELASAMTSLREAAGDHAIDPVRLRHAFIDRLMAGIGALRSGRFDEAGWTARQVTTDRMVRLEGTAGHEMVRAVGVDADTGALVVEDADGATGQRLVVVGEISHVRLADPAAVRV